MLKCTKENAYAKVKWYKQQAAQAVIDGNNNVVSNFALSVLLGKMEQGQLTPKQVCNKIDGYATLLEYQ